MSKIFIFGNAKLHSNYVRAINGEKHTVEISYDLKYADKADALVLCGGGDLHPVFYGETPKDCFDVDTERDVKEFSLIERFIYRKKLIVGICRGMQVVNVFLGGKLEKDVSSSVEHRRINGIDGIHGVYNAKNSLIAKTFSIRCDVNSAHHQTVRYAGEGLLTESLCSDGNVEAQRHRTLPIYLTQFHPERMSYPLPNGKKLLDEIFGYYL